jgi:Predicted Co/Zn/Cd cation transporters
LLSCGWRRSTKSSATVSSPRHCMRLPRIPRTMFLPQAPCWHVQLFRRWRTSILTHGLALPLAPILAGAALNLFKIRWARFWVSRPILSWSSTLETRSWAIPAFWAFTIWWFTTTVRAGSLQVRMPRWRPRPARWKVTTRSITSSSRLGTKTAWLSHFTTTPSWPTIPRWQACVCALTPWLNKSIAAFRFTICVACRVLRTPTWSSTACVPRICRWVPKT